MPELSQRLQEALGDRFRIERTLGRGGMATVYLAEDLKHGRRVAIKVLDPEVAAAIGPERFLHEIETIARLTHPHILPLHDSGAAEGLLYYVMPYVEGESLRDRLIRDKQLPVEDALRIAREVADALDYAHRRGVVHRDIKPGNILLEEQHALVADFGIARAVVAAEGEKLTSSGIAVGTPTYMSPEQAAGSRDLDGRSDLYSLGCVLYEMLAGVPPFAGSSAESLAHQHLNLSPRPVTELRPAVAAATRDALDKALAKTPADRYRTVSQFADALASPGADRAPHASAWVHGRRSRRIAPVLATILGVAVLLVLAWEWNPGRLRERLLPGWKQPRVESLAVMPLENLSRDPEQEYFTDGLTEALIAELYRISALKKVVSPKSVMMYKGTRKPTAQIAKELKVDALIEGSAIRDGNKVRVTVHLIDGTTDAQLWADSFDRDYRDILALYSDVARAIAEGIQVKLSPADFAHRRTVDPAAYQLYLKGQYYWNKATAEGLQKGLDYFQQAIDKDPSYAQAYSGMSNSFSMLGVHYRSPRETFPRARAAALRALTLDSTIAESHVSIAAVKVFYDWDWTGVGYHTARAIALAPNYPSAHNLRAYYLELTGRQNEAMAEARWAQELDPLVLVLNLDVGIRHYFARRYEQAIEQYRGVFDIDPNPALVSYWLWLAYEQQGDYAGALAEFRRLTAGPDRPAVEVAPRDSLGHKGYMAALRKQLPRLEALHDRHKFWATDIAAIHTMLGETDLAFEWLERAYQDRESKLPWIKLDPRFDALRADPSFQGLLRRMNLAS
jgi:serine/threonine-protein kinase